MTADSLYPVYIARGEEEAIRNEIGLVQADGKSRAVLLYGPGGVGKTTLVRGMARAGRGAEVTWLDPVDVDDPEFWLLSSLERRVAGELDPEHRYFGPYLAYLSRLPSSTQPRIGHETVVSHLGRIKRVFVDCYTEFIKGTGRTVIMVFDTVEAIRGVYLVYTLTQWMKALPGTLFILSGRPQAVTGGQPDPIRAELEDPYQRLPIKVVTLAELAQEDARQYLGQSSIAAALEWDEREKLVLLTRGHPLWLAFTIAYLRDYGIPEEATDPLETIEQHVPYGGDLTPEGQQRHEAFKRRLVTPYQGVDFWHEAIKRLAVVRQSVNQEVWRRLMDDHSLPDTVPDLDQAWEQLLKTPWIRTRANGRYVTLHDAVAEELAQRIIPLHDQNQQWRSYLWSRAAGIYSELTERPEAELAANLATLNDRLNQMEERLRQELDDAPTDDQARREEAEETASIAEAERLDAQKRELDQLRAASLYYRLLCDFADGSGLFLKLFDQARNDRDVFFLDRLALEIQRFLPGAAQDYAIEDVIAKEVDGFGKWLVSEGKHYYLGISLSVADYLIDNERSPEAVELLTRLPGHVTALADDVQRCRLNLLKGNAYMRIPDEVDAGLPYFDLALNDARQSTDPYRLVANAYNEKGYYFRNGGHWPEAEDCYRAARDDISKVLLARDANQDHEDLASIQTNWAYLKGLRGDYREGTSLVESAIKVRRRLGLLHQEAISWSVCGEVYRYERQFQKAWNAFLAAQEIFQGQRNWSWLGLIYQEQAICLFQAYQDDIELGTEARHSAIERARRRIVWALDICRDQNIRAYPSALNRAGRIFAAQEPETALAYLREGIDQARRLSDGWFWFANLIEYAELNYRVYLRTEQGQYRGEIQRVADAIAAVARRYRFLDLEGRWSLLQGHLAIQDATTSGDMTVLSAALDNYKSGFMKIADGYVGSSGAPVLPTEFTKFRGLFIQLPPNVKSHWLTEFRRAWSGSSPGSTQLLARLEELY
jgi:tetratricopeptide (TPR) repeat protein